MDTRDVRIGSNIQRLREGNMTQTELAQRMKAVGHPWSQPTVVAVEQGKRALRLGEAFDLAQILGVEHVEELGSSVKSNAMVARFLRLQDAALDILRAAKAYDEARLDFANAAIAAQEHENTFAGHGIRAARRTPEGVIAAARDRGEYVEPPAIAAAAARIEELYGGID